jgi:hypothetical protein
MFHVNLLFTEQSSSLTPITHCELNWPANNFTSHTGYTHTATHTTPALPSVSPIIPWNLIRGERSAVYCWLALTAQKTSLLLLRGD